MIFKYLQKRRDRIAEIEASDKKRKEEIEACREQERNRTVLIVPDTQVYSILKLYDNYHDENLNKNVNRWNLWESIENILPETAEGNWYIDVRGSNIIKIVQIFGKSQWDSYYGDVYWDANNKKLGLGD